MGSGRIGGYAIAAAVAVTLLAGAFSRHHIDATLAPLGYALLTVSGLTLLARNRWPVPVLVVTGLCALGYQAAGFDVPAVAFLFAVYAAVRAGHRWTTVVASVVLVAALPVAVLASGQPVGAAFAQARGALELAWLVAAGAAGEALRQAEQRAGEAERTREETARRRADEERLHIARELHDSLTHQISVIKVQSEAAVHVARKRGEPVSEALLAIREAGREAARELRATLEALRDDAAAARPGIADVPDLLERLRVGGLPTTLAIDGAPGELSTAVDRTVYRIVQESLTNVIRHAGTAAATVRIVYQPGAVVVRIEDNGTATTDSVPPHGVGLRGMRERVTALGGRLHAAPRPEGGFRVQAELPVERAS
ncbi:sensor histidine kinase [Nocardia stercoris]|uniref:histidine kinase n=1 Tax=Nocardia stercoris TaxID=2483361 RepID=A0A3M2L1I4_9NOCA|nr:histidine kinase [Nocardia stercoris]RMI28408.1 sensor histidine kinase [Nocardia stercoris]